ncbi:extracellular matrix protein [Colletotrichum tofieldiae]|nr:extracellular matrix protein [Colletotrichum tofieldiae]GKT75748.1 extracellular matrix protein [Colletotrichum tofieldiae]
MKSFTSVLVAGFAALAQAVQLTNSNFDVQAGEPFTITWSDAQGPVTLTLKNGPSTNLATVQTITCTSSTSGSTSSPTTVPGSDSARIGSPIALIGLTVAAMLYFQ